MKRFITSNTKAVLKQQQQQATSNCSRQYGSRLPFSHRTAPRFVMPLLERIPELRREDYENPEAIVKLIPKNATEAERIQLSRYIKYLEMRQARKKIMEETRERVERGDKESIEKFKNYRRDVLQYRQKKYILSMDNIRETETYQKIIDLEQKRQKIEAGYTRYNRDAKLRSKRVAGIARLSRESASWITPETIDAHLAKEFSLNRVTMDTSFVGIQGVNDEVQYDLETEIELGNYIPNKKVNIAARQHRDPMYPEQPLYASDRVSHINPYSKDGSFSTTNDKTLKTRVTTPKTFPLSEEDVEFEDSPQNTHSAMSFMLHADKLQRDLAPGVTNESVMKLKNPSNVTFSMAYKLSTNEMDLDMYHEDGQSPSHHDILYDDEQYLLDTHRLSIKEENISRLDSILDANKKRLQQESGINLDRALEVTKEEVDLWSEEEDKHDNDGRITMNQARINIDQNSTRRYSTNKSCTPSQWQRLYQSEEKEIRRMIKVAMKQYKITKIPPFSLERPPLNGSMDHSMALPIFPFKKDMAKKINVELTPPEDLSKKEKKKWLKQQEDPCAIAIAAALPVNDSNMVDRVEVKGTYINFHFSPQYIGQVLAKDTNFYKRHFGKTKKVMVEFSQPNTHKAFHVGHMRNVAIGDALIQQLKHEGHQVIAVNYIGDEGTHIAKCLWFLLYRHIPEKYAIDTKEISNLLSSSMRPANMPEKLLSLVPTHQTPVEFLGDMYSQGCNHLDLSSYTSMPFPNWVSATIEEILEQGCLARYNDTLYQVHVNEEDLSALSIGAIIGIALPGSSNPITSSPVKPYVINDIEYNAILLKKSHLKEKSEAIAFFDKANEQLTVLGALNDTSLDTYEQARAQLNKVRSLLEDVPEGSIFQDLVKTTKQWSMDDFFAIYNWLGVKFDRFYFESKVNADGKDMVIRGAKKGVLEENDDGMIGIHLNDLGYCVLLTSARQGLYATKDLALAKQKMADYGHLDESYLIVDEQQILHFKQVFKVLALLGKPKLASIQKHFPYGTVRLSSGKMSSRDGSIIPFSVLKQNLISFMQQLSQKSTSISSKDYELIYHRLAVGALKFGMLTQDPMSPIIFDLESWSQPQGNTGPYVIYAYVRIQSILRKSLNQHDSVRFLHPHLQGQSFPVDYHLELFYDVDTDWTLLTHPTERRLLQLLHDFHFVCQRVRTQDFSHHLLCHYLIVISRMFSRYYEECNILNNSRSTNQLHARLHLLSITSDTIRSGLNLLGISTVSKL